MEYKKGKGKTEKERGKIQRGKSSDLLENRKKMNKWKKRERKKERRRNADRESERV